MNNISQPSSNFKSWLENIIPKFVISPSFLLTIIFVYAFIIWTGIISFSNSTLLPVYDFVGWKQYLKLWKNPNWIIALKNLFVFGSLYIFFCCLIGVFLAILIDQKVKFENLIRPIILYPMALSFIVTGTVWKWILNPQFGLENSLKKMGWESFAFDWIVDSEKAIYTLVIVAVWQSSGFVMTMFLAGLRGIDANLIKAAYLEGANLFQIYLKIIIPQLRYTLVSVIIILMHIAIKSYDLVVALTGGGPGKATEVPGTFMYSFTFTRSRMGIGAASAIIMLLMIALIIIPYLYLEMKDKKNAK